MIILLNLELSGYTKVMNKIISNLDNINISKNIDLFGEFFNSKLGIKLNSNLEFNSRESAYINLRIQNRQLFNLVKNGNLISCYEFKLVNNLITLQLMYTDEFINYIKSDFSLYPSGNYELINIMYLNNEINMDIFNEIAGIKYTSIEFKGNNSYIFPLAF